LPPRICPPPPDCPLYAQRLDYSSDEPLRRAVLTERRRADLAALVRAEAGRPGALRPSSPPTRPVLTPAPEPLPILDHLTRKGATP
jgi:hypothetical protein